MANPASTQSCLWRVVSSALDANSGWGLPWSPVKPNGAAYTIVERMEYRKYIYQSEMEGIYAKIN